MQPTDGGLIALLVLASWWMLSSKVIYAQGFGLLVAIATGIWTAKLCGAFQ